MKKTFKKVCLFFGLDIEARRWLKKHGYPKKSIDDISSEMSDDELEEAIGFLQLCPRPDFSLYEIFSLKHLLRDRCLDTLYAIRSWRSMEKEKAERLAEIQAIDWRKVSLENLRLDDSGMPKEIDPIRIYERTFTLFFCYNGKEYTVGLYGADWVWGTWWRRVGEERFLGKDDIFKKMPENALERVRKAVTEDKWDLGPDSVAQVMAYNVLIKERMALRKKQAAEKIVKERLKEKIRYRLKHCYRSASARK